MIIQTEFQQNPFVAVPRYVIQLVGEKISPEALGVLVWLAGRPVGAQVQVTSVCRALRLGKDKWQRIARELREVGALFLAPTICNQTGRVAGKSYSVRWPEPAAKVAKIAQKPRAGKPAIFAKPRAGKSGAPQPENPALSYKEYKIKEGPKPTIAPETFTRSASPQSVAASLGLPVLDPSTGVWRRVQVIAENVGGGNV